MTKNCYERNYGIDILRIVAMFMIANVHILNHGGVVEHVSGSHFIITWLIEAIIICAVNCYAIISGYVGYREEKIETQYGKYIVLWLQVFVYSVLLSLGVQFFSGNIEVREIIKAFMPVTSTQYWYFTAYTALFFLTPWLKKFVYHLSNQEAKKCLAILGVFACYITFAGILYDPFILAGDYSFVWLTVMYVIGALFKKMDLISFISIKAAWIMAGVCVVLNWIQKLIIPSQNIFMKYTSITVVILSVALLVIFSRIEIKKCLVKKIIKYLASATFGVYLIHDNIAIRNYFIKDQFAWVAYIDAWKIPIVVLAISACIFIGCLAIDICRGMLFEKLKISEYSARMIQKVKETGR